MLRLNHLRAALLIAAAATLSSEAWAGSDAVLGGGLKELVAAHERSDLRLPMHLSHHITSPAGDPLVHVKLEAGQTLADVLPQLQAAGFQLKTVSSIDPSRIDGYLPLANAKQAAALGGVKPIAARLRPITFAGSVQSQAVHVEKADLAQTNLNVDGTGIKIGVLSDSYDMCLYYCRIHAADDITSGDLPAGGVTVLEDDTYPFDEDEGRAMLQLVHDIAPGATLGFATAFVSELDFANNIVKLRNDFHADVIVDDVFYFEEPMYSDGIVAQAVTLATTAGAAYFSSAGNNGMEAYEATYQPISYASAKQLVYKTHSNLKLDQIPLALRPKSFHLFSGPGTVANGSISQLFTSLSNNTIDFQWDEPFYVGKVKTDFNVYIFDANGNWLDPNSQSFPGYYTTDDNTKTDIAFEYAYLPTYPNQFQAGIAATDYQIVIGNMNNGPAQHIKYAVANGLGESQRQGASSVWGHSSAPGAQSVGAVFYALPTFPEAFSSAGPTTIYFDTAGNRLLQPIKRVVPQIMGADGVDTTFFPPGGSDPDNTGYPNFFGTSAAAPDVAAVAALVMQKTGGPGTISPRDLYGVLQSTATPIPLANDRTWSLAQVGPLTYSAQDDYSRWRNFHKLELGGRNQTVKSVVLDLTNTPYVWQPGLPSSFAVGDSLGVSGANVSAVISQNNKSATLTFVQGSFKSGEYLQFSLPLLFPARGSYRATPDSLRGMQVTATFGNNAVNHGVVQAAPIVQHSNTTGAGLVNAYAAVSAVQPVCPTVSANPSCAARVAAVTH